jgi:hypothetical protein
MMQEHMSRQNLKQVQLTAVREIMRATSTALPLAELMPLIANMTIIAFDALTVWVMLAEGDQLRTVVARGADAAVLLEASCPLVGCVVGNAANGSEPVILAAAQLDQADPVLAALAHHPEPVVLVPITAGTQPLGLLGATAPPEALDDLSFLGMLATQVAGAIETNQLRNAAQTWQQRLDAVFAQMNQPVLIYDADGTLALMNPTAEALLHTLQVQPGDHLTTLASKTGMRDQQGRPLAPAQLASARALRGEAVVNQEQIWPQPDGSARYLLANAMPLESNGLIEGAVVVWNDITARKQADQALAESEVRFQQFAAATSAVFWMSDPRQRRLLYVSPAYEQVWGRTREAVYADYMQWLNAIHPEDRPRVETAFFSRIYAGGYDEEFRIVRPDGTMRWVRDRGFPMRNSEGLITHVGGIAEDITERKQVEQERDETLALLDSLLNTAPVGFALFDEEYRFCRINERLAAINGLSVADHLGRSVREVLPELGDQAEAMIQGVFASGEPYLEWELSGETPAAPGVERHWSENFYPVRGRDGRMLGVGAVVSEITERKRAELALRASEERFRAVQELSLDALAISRSVRDHNGAVVDFVYEYVNPALARLVNLPAEQLIGRGLLELFPNARTNGLFTHLREVVETGVPQEFDQQYTGDNIHGWFRNLAMKFGDGVVNNVSNITARKREAAATVLLADVSRLQDAALDMLAVPQSVTRLLVPAFADYCVLHLRNGDSQLHLAAVAHRDSSRWETVEQLYRRYETSFGQPGSMAHRVLHSGKPILTSVVDDDHIASLALDMAGQATVRQLGPRSSIMVPLVARGQTLGILICVTSDSGRRYDVEDLHLAEELARRAAVAIDNARLYDLAQQARATAEAALERLTRLYDLTSAFAMALTPERVATTLMEQGLPALGASAGFVAQLSDDSNTFAIIGSKGYAPEVIAAWQQFPATLSIPVTDAVRTHAPIWLPNLATMAQHYPNRSGDYTNCAWAAIPLLVDDRAIGGLGLSFAQERECFSPADQDFILALAGQCAQALERSRLYEDERVARQEAQEATHMRDVFLSIAAHELRTPLTSLLGQAQLILRRVQQSGEASPRVQQAISIINEQSLRLNRLITALLDLSRLELGQLSIAREACDLSALLRRVVDEIQPSLERHRVVCNLPTQPLVIEGDELRLEQVLQNLIQNAIKYSPNGGLVQVNLERHDHHASISVRDEGIGIPDTALPQLFQRFYRAENAAATQISGFGVGLYVVREVVHLHGGSISVASEEGQGSTFTVLLPLAGTRDP